MIPKVIQIQMNKKNNYLLDIQRILEHTNVKYNNKQYNN